jgi:hypothetical protein
VLHLSATTNFPPVRQAIWDPSRRPPSAHSIRYPVLPRPVTGSRSVCTLSWLVAGFGVWVFSLLGFTKPPVFLHPSSCCLRSCWFGVRHWVHMHRLTVGQSRPVPDVADRAEWNSRHGAFACTHACSYADMQHGQTRQAMPAVWGNRVFQGPAFRIFGMRARPLANGPNRTTGRTAAPSLVAHNPGINLLAEFFELLGEAVYFPRVRDPRGFAV